MQRYGSPMTSQEIYEAIVEQGLYNFKAAIPSAIVRGEIRKHCKGVNFSSASRTKHFTLVDGNKYFYLEKPVTERPKSKSSQNTEAKSGLGMADIKSAQAKHKQAFTDSLIKQIKKISPENFEHFTKNLLEAYGFIDVEVTNFSKDGGIDGYGQLKVGLGLITVAFQCKRYTTKSVSAPEIQQFRGAIQGKCEQGLFFTTSKFSKGSDKHMFQAGAVPIILIDGKGIVDIMIEKNFGVQTEYIPTYINALDLAFLDN